MSEVILDLARLTDMHPLLPVPIAREFAFRGGMALQGQGHRTPCQLEVDMPGAETKVTALIQWQPVLESDRLQADVNRTTEDGAEAIALALVKAMRGWKVRRRLQNGESADWLLLDDDNNLVALEISGVNGAPSARRLREKVRQVANVKDVTCRSACVVAFAAPVTFLADA
jgi:hypothetical protein